MQYTNLPGTDIEVSRIAFGCMSLVPSESYEGVAAEQARGTIEAALDMGINFFDTAPSYGNGVSEQLLGQALKHKRDQAVIATKASGQTLSEQEILADCQSSLERLQTDVIDLYQIHWPRHVVPMEETVAALEKLKKAGKIRSVGVSNFGPQDLSEFLELSSSCATDQIAYSLLTRAVEYELRDLCLEHDVGLLCYSPLAQSLLSGRYETAGDVPTGRARTRHFSHARPQARHEEAGCEQQTFQAITRIREICEELGEPMPKVALAWLLHQPAVTAVLAGGSRPEQLQANAAVADLQLNEDALQTLDAATLPVKEGLGANLDVWAATSRIR